MNKIKKILIYSLTLVLFSTFTSPSYAYGGAISRAIAKALQSFSKTIPKFSDDIIRRIKPGDDVTRIKPKELPQKSISENIAKTTEKTGEQSASKSKEKIKSFGYGLSGAALYAAINKQLSDKEKKTYEELNINSENIYSSIVKIGTSEDNQSGAGFFINNDTILTNYHVLEKFYKSKLSADLDPSDTATDIWLTTSPYCFSINKKFIERIGINDSCPTDYLLLRERTDQKNCLSRSGSNETLEPVNVSCAKDYVQIEETDVQIILIDGHKILGYVIEADKNLDIVAIKIKSEFRDSFNYLEFHTGQVPEEKSTVFAIGHPFGLEYTETDGTISAYRDNNKKRIFDKNSKDIVLIQTNTTINKGNSGGPLMYNGKVIGLISTTFKKEFAEGISFALYFEKIKDFLREHRIQT